MMMNFDLFYASFQIENEYGDIDSAYGSKAKTYISWAASMAVSLDTGVPWVMCQQNDAPNPIVCGLLILVLLAEFTTFGS